MYKLLTTAQAYIAQAKHPSNLRLLRRKVVDANENSKLASSNLLRHLVLSLVVEGDV